jgi:hypothetical protein
MTAPLFTPGPWFFRTYPDTLPSADDFHLIQGLEGDEGGSILEGALVLASDKANKANAHLIAAAPELYDALERLLEALPDTGCDDEIIAAAAALAKARGEA